MTRSRAAPDRDLTDDQRRALVMLAGSPHGCTESILRAHGFSVGLLAGLLRTGLAKASADEGSGRAQAQANRRNPATANRAGGPHIVGGTKESGT
jgi:hypothetical protein